MKRGPLKTVKGAYWALKRQFLKIGKTYKNMIIVCFAMCSLSKDVNITAHCYCLRIVEQKSHASKYKDSLPSRKAMYWLTMCITFPPSR